MDPSIVTTEQFSATLSHDANSNPSNVAEPSETSLDDLAKGIASLLTTAFTDFDSKASDAVRSQDNLLFSIHRLTKELDQLLEDAPVPFILQHAAKISAVRRRVSSLNSLLRSIQRRLDNIDRTLSFVGSSQDKAKMEGPTQQ
uniref:Biogenesis of lysosome-related organelles complex 1 subunit 7 n=1 Tax=Kalanchoe fedtschenkoi TaxID=63787 RepID=A0A7N0T099_KALFE